MLIILEGPDCAGKSTLADQLVTQLAVRYPRDTVELLHRGPPTSHPLDEYVTPLLDYRPGERRHIICDRWHLGEWVYPRLLRRKTKMDAAVFTYIELFLRGRGATTFVMIPPVEVLTKRFDVRGDDVARRENLADVSRMFYAVTQQTNAYVHFHGPSVDDVIARARGAETNATTDRVEVTRVGSPYPKILLVGDVRGCDGRKCEHPTTHSPLGTAFMPYPATSGHFLMRALDIHGSYGYPHIALMNACDVDDITPSWQKMGRPVVVTLGVNACRRLDMIVPHAAAPHPQFIRRFHHRSVAEYGQLIREIAGTERNELTWRPSSTEVQDSASTRASSTTS